MPKNKIKNFNASEMGKLSHKKHPRTKEFYSTIGKKGNEIRWKKSEQKDADKQNEYMDNRVKQGLSDY